MKLSQVPTPEKCVKVSFSLRNSTNERLKAYQAYYCKQMGTDAASVGVKEIAEQILNDFILSDKDFARYQAGTKPSAATPAAPASSAVSPPSGILRSTE